MQSSTQYVKELQNDLKPRRSRLKALHVKLPQSSASKKLQIAPIPKRSCARLPNAKLPQRSM